ncbi:MAG: histidinol dehydrogenase [Bacteroidetes bacterium]|nr:MAG: histidinol dehydrogenase [Bacteroidota bacterium]
MNIIENPPRETWGELLKRPAMDSEYLDQAVEDIFFSVKRNGDQALKDFTRAFDGVEIEKLQVSGKEIDASEKMVSPGLQKAIQTAAANIRKFHAAQQCKPVRLETAPGVVCWQKPVALQRVGLYIPGGTAPLFSSVLMLAVPAQIAGCREIVLCTPPGKDGKVNPAILYAAKISGVTGVYTVGGAQAIAAMAFGTESIPKVNKIFGPGNQFVTAAKQAVQKMGVAIDLPAGPSEVLVMADETADARFVASDLLSQAEHGPDSQVILVTSQKKLAEDTIIAMEEQLKQLPRREMIEESLKSCKIIVMNQVSEIVGIVNEYAPEHLIIAMKDMYKVADTIENAGSVFMGNFTPESAGDYASGTNHTLPTNGFAKAYSGVNLDSFVKKITFQEITPAGLQGLSETLQQMAEAENLHAHKLAVSVRLEGI